MGNIQNIRYANFEDIQTVINNTNMYLLINTLSENEQHCLIENTVSINKEEGIINTLIKTNLNKHIVIYGKNCNDTSIEIKYKQLYNLGFRNLLIYKGGLFEWLLLQDIYGSELFPTNKKENDLLQYKSNSILNIQLIEYT